MRAIATRLTLVGLMAALLAAPAWAQRGRPGGPPGRMGGMFFRGGKLMLLRMEPVQSELKLTDEQKELLRDVGEEVREKMQALREVDREQRFVEMRKIMRTAEEMVDAILEPKQAQRLNEIELQVAVRVAGAAVFLRPQVAEKLGLTDEQKEKLQKIAEEGRIDFRRMREMSPEQRREFFRGLRERMRKLREESMAKAWEVLTKEQRETWEKMLGAPFNVDDLPFFGRPGRGGPRFRGGEGRGAPQRRGSERGAVQPNEGAVATEAVARPQ